MDGKLEQYCKGSKENINSKKVKQIKALNKKMKKSSCRNPLCSTCKQKPTVKIASIIINIFLIVDTLLYLHKIIEDFVIYITVGKCYSLIVNFEK